MKKTPIRRFDINDVPEFRRFKAANPQNPSLDSWQTVFMYVQAIHWISILDMLWPDFDEKEYYSVEVAYLTINDPDDQDLPPSFYQYIAQMIAMFWEIRLEQLYPNGSWSVEIDDDVEITVSAEIKSRG